LAKEFPAPEEGKKETRGTFRAAKEDGGWAIPYFSSASSNAQFRGDAKSIRRQTHLPHLHITALGSRTHQLRCMSTRHVARWPRGRHNI